MASEPNRPDAVNAWCLECSSEVNMTEDDECTECGELTVPMFDWPAVRNMKAALERLTAESETWRELGRVAIESAQSETTREAIRQRDVAVGHLAKCHDDLRLYHPQADCLDPAWEFLKNQRPDTQEGG